MSSPPDQPDPPLQPPVNRGEDIRIFRGLEHIRHRAEMYIGSVDERGLRLLVEELAWQAEGEALAGLCDHISIELLPEGGIRTTDNGPGSHLPFWEGRFLITENEYITSPSPYPVGLYGYRHMGMLLANTLSSRLVVEVIRDGTRWRQEFHRGEAEATAKVEPCNLPTGTSFEFWPDPEVFGNPIELDFAELAERFQQMAWLLPSLAIDLIDRRSRRTRKKAFRPGAGLVDYVYNLNRRRHVLHSHVFFCDGKAEGQECEIAVQWTEAPDELVLCFGNFHHNVAGGTHEAGFRHAITRVLNRYAPFFGPVEHGSLTSEDWRAGLTAVVSVKHEEPQFGTATLARLNNPETEGFVRTAVEHPFAIFLESHADAAQAIGQHALEAFQRRMGRKEEGKRRS